MFINKNLLTKPFYLIKKLWHFLTKTKTRKIILIIVIIAFSFKSCSGGIKKITPEMFEMAPAKIANIKKSVSASGSINPVSVVTVGAQVSGIVKKIYKNFNDSVKKGDLLLEIDKTILKEEVKAVEARYSQAVANYKMAEKNKQRKGELFKSGFISKMELDSANTEYIVARAVMTSSKADFERSKRNLGFTEIKAPVSGVVISKAVEEGQTIAASFSSPTLFKIAEDLTRMKISASVSEVDIGNIKKGQEVSFVVDAFPNDKFKGRVEEIRLNPTIEQGVVIYNVIILIDNSNLKFLPGMTAFVEIDTFKQNEVLSIDNYVLGFNPDKTLEPFVDYQNMELVLKNGKVVPKLEKEEGLLYRLQNGKLVAVKIKKGITNGTLTEIKSGDVIEGDKFVFDFITIGK